MSIDLHDGLLMYEVVQNIGYDYAYQMFRFAAVAAKQDWSQADEDVFRLRINAVLASVARQIDELDDPAEFALQFTYPQLLERKITRQRAADIASLLMQEPMMMDTWRKRMDRWVEAQGLPKIELYHGRRKPDKTG